MENITYTDARQHLKSTMDKVCSDRSPVIITRQDAEAVVMMSLADYNAIEETAYLLRSPNNARNLMDAYDDAKAGRGLIKYESPTAAGKKQKKSRTPAKPRRRS